MCLLIPPVTKVCEEQSLPTHHDGGAAAVVWILERKKVPVADAIRGFLPACPDFDSVSSTQCPTRPRKLKGHERHVCCLGLGSVYW